MGIRVLTNRMDLPARNSLVFRSEYYKIIGACFEVHKVLGAGFLEAIYSEALCHEFTKRKIPFIKEKKLLINYKNTILQKEYYVDFMCYEKIIIELKALQTIRPEHEAQIINYLKASNVKLGILVNFGTMHLQHKRFILTTN